MLAQVLGKAFEVITHLVAESSVTKKDAFTAMGGLVDKMSDIKLKGPAGEALFAISEALGPQFTITQLHKKAATHKNPKVKSPKFPPPLPSTALFWWQTSVNNDKPDLRKKDASRLPAIVVKCGASIIKRFEEK